MVRVRIPRKTSLIKGWAETEEPGETEKKISSEDDAVIDAEREKIFL